MAILNCHFYRLKSIDKTTDHDWTHCLTVSILQVVACQKYGDENGISKHRRHTYDDDAVFLLRLRLTFSLPVCFPLIMAQLPDPTYSYSYSQGFCAESSMGSNKSLRVLVPFDIRLVETEPTMTTTFSRQGGSCYANSESKVLFPSNPYSSALNHRFR